MRACVIAVVLALVASVALVLLFRFVPPPTSAFMIGRKIDSIVAREALAVDYRWVPIQRISANVGIAFVAAEDQRFPLHHGFDFEAISDALEARERGGRLRGASTISQQVAKNLFLWQEQSWLRKGLEAWFTVLIEALWPKPRILEVYANVAELGDGIYGVEAAAQRYFGKPASALTRREASLLAAVLPSPRRWRVDPPGPYVSRRATWIERQIAQLGGPAYLDRE